MKIPRPWLALAAGLVIGAITAFAQPVPHPGFPLPMLAEIEGALNLTAAQKAQFDIAAAATRQVIEAAHTRHQELNAVTDAEMAKVRPDLAALAAARDAEIDAARASHVAARGEWLRLYALLDDSQVGVVKAFLEERMLRIDTLRENPGPRRKGVWG